MSAWREQQASNDGTHRAAVNSILEVHDWQTRDGRSIAIDHRFDRVFQDGGRPFPWPYQSPTTR